MDAVTHPEAGRRSETGFTLIEVMLAMFILGLGLLTVSAMQLQAITQGSAGRHSQDAAAIARTALEQVHRLPWTEITDAQAAGTWTATDWPGAAGSVDVDVTDPDGGSAITKTYTVDWIVENVMDGATPRDCLRDIEVRVQWPEEDVSGNKELTLATRRYAWGESGC